MPTSATINLLKISQPASPELAQMEKMLSRLATGAVLLLLIAGSITGAGYLFVKQRIESLENTRDRLIKDIAAQSQKEVLYIAVKDRIDILNQILPRQLQGTKLYDLVASIASPPILRSFSVSKEKELSIQITTDNLEEVAGILSTIHNLYVERTVEHPRIDSFQVTPEEGITITLAFFAGK